MLVKAKPLNPLQHHYRWRISARGALQTLENKEILNVIALNCAQIQGF